MFTDLSGFSRHVATESFRRALGENGAVSSVVFEPLDVDVPGTDKSCRTAYTLPA